MTRQQQEAEMQSMTEGVRLVHVNKALCTSRNFMMVYMVGKVRGPDHVQRTIEKTLEATLKHVTHVMS